LRRRKAPQAFLSGLADSADVRLRNSCRTMTARLPSFEWIRLDLWDLSKNEARFIGGRRARAREKTKQEEPIKTGKGIHHRRTT
jgi:hypothetical protein